jgi:cell wall-associated protease
MRILFMIVLFLEGALPGWGQQINWQNMDLKTDSVFGISTEKAYRELLAHKKHHTVIVGVVDSGVDTTHEDLRGLVLRGWDFIGGPRGDVWHENLECTRIVRDQGRYFDSLSTVGVPLADSAGYLEYTRALKDYNSASAEARERVDVLTRFKILLDSVRQGVDSLTLPSLKAYRPRSNGERWVCGNLIRVLSNGGSVATFVAEALDGPLKHYQGKLDYYLNVNYQPRSVVGDDPNDALQSDYGNSDCQGPDALHGTHVAGIIGALRHNRIGMDGVADDVRILPVRVVPDGDERDKDVANGIRWAVDHGARVINMSFGKAYARNKAEEDEAVRYAMAHDVLLVQAAGNEGEDLDSSYNIPNRVFLDGSVAPNWIVVGASAFKDDTNLVAPFSNYGHLSVDVFAPGVSIYSCVPPSSYAVESGTSMAAPVVAGLAALIRSYYPKLTAVEVKDIILRSVVLPGHLVRVGDRLRSLSDVCVTGGVVNAYEALKLAGEYRHHG